MFHAFTLRLSRQPFQIPQEVILFELFKYIPLEEIADLFNPSYSYIELLSKFNPPVQLEAPVAHNEIFCLRNLKSWLNGELNVSRPWFICNPNIFRLYLTKKPHMVLETLYYRPQPSFTLGVLLVIFDRLDLIKILNKMQPKFFQTRNTMLTHAISLKRFDIFNYLYTETCLKVDNSVLNCAAEFGHLDLVKKLHCDGHGCTTMAMDSAAKNGHLEVVEWLHFNRGEGCTAHAIDNAAKRNHVAVVKFLLSSRTEGFTNAAINSAVRNGCIELINLLLEHKDR